MDKCHNYVSCHPVTFITLLMFQPLMVCVFFFFFVVLITIESCNLVVFFRPFIFLIFLFSDVFQTKQHRLPVEQREVAFTCAL